MPTSRQPSFNRLSLPHKLVSATNDRAQAFVDWWLRMHRGRRPLIAERLRFVEWAEGGQSTQRFVWEVCRWPSGDSARWMFVCWMIDGVGMWWKAFPSKREALAYFGQAPEVVMAHKSSNHANEEEKRAS